MGTTAMSRARLLKAANTHTGIDSLAIGYLEHHGLHHGRHWPQSLLIHQN